jgi:predicted RNA-binding Zn-ribbon protein involved in translation (DUF1610 family)
MTEDKAEPEVSAAYPPCPNCGNESLASITDHSCSSCADTYRYCPRCANRPTGG